MKTLLLTSLLSLASLSSGFAAEALNPRRESASLAEQRRQTLEELERDIVQKFTTIEGDLVARNHRSALNLAKQVLDNVRAKTGIDPKIRREESFLVPATFPKNAKVFADLPEAQQSEVITVVADFRGGLYMDIMNLSKRVTLLYIKALKAQMEATGGLTQEDKDKIVNDLVRISIVPMKIEDKKGVTIIAIDEDIANEDHIYMFNREIKQFIISATELGVSEADFNKRKQELKESFAPRPVQVQTNALDFARRCVSAAKASNAYADNRDSALNICISNYVTSSQATYEGCSELVRAYAYADNRDRAYRTCTSRVR